MVILPYNRKFKERSQELRKQGILGEVLLWKHLKKKQILGHQFFRQKPIDNYILDFFCKKLMLAIEIDGGSHNAKVEGDKFRQDTLELMGIRFLRFTEKEVQNNIESVVQNIKERVTALNSPLEGSTAEPGGM